MLYTLFQQVTVNTLLRMISINHYCLMPDGYYIVEEFSLGSPSPGKDILTIEDHQLLHMHTHAHTHAFMSHIQMAGTLKFSHSLKCLAPMAKVEPGSYFHIAHSLNLWKTTTILLKPLGLKP